jgi:uncharacterized damage-inducible protein DinB
MLLDAFAHHVWATQQLLDACATLDAAQLGAPAAGTFGSIQRTLRHLVGSDSFYLFWLTGEPAHDVDPDAMDLAALRSVMERNGAAWSHVLGQDLDPDAVIVEVDDDGAYEKRAPVGIRLAQALHHGSEHRGQVCTALAALGLEPPNIDVWDFGLHNGRVVERYDAGGIGPG